MSFERQTFVFLTLSKDGPRSGEMEVEERGQTAFQKPTVAVSGGGDPFFAVLFFYLPTFLEEAFK